jgi:NHL repeat
MGGAEKRERISTPAHFCRGAILLFLGLVGAGVLSPAASAAEECPNEQFRTGLSAPLPDCRAYELVTPPDTNGRLVGAIDSYDTPPLVGRFPTELFSPSRDSFLYMSYTSPLLGFGGANGITDVYEAERTGAGWVTTRRIGPPGYEASPRLPGGASSDHLFSSVNVSSGSLALEGPTEYLVNPDGSWELVGVGSLGSEPFAQTRYIGEGGGHILFSTGNSPALSIWCSLAESCKVQQLEPNAPPTGTAAIYDRAPDGPTQVVSLLPGDVPPAAGKDALYKGASKDASTVAFAIEGTLYVRLDNAETAVASGGNPTFAGLSDDGRFLFYVLGGNIHRFDTETEEDDEVNSTGDGKVVNVSADGSHVFFVSESQIGGKGQAGQPNLYAWDGAATSYVGTVLPKELESTPGLTKWNEVVAGAEYGLGASTARTTPDGEALVFQSAAQLTPYDNDGHVEIYRYEDGEEAPTCVSCNPLAEPATADARLQELKLAPKPTVIHNLSDDGSRVFFETKEALVGRDGGEVNDIYQWSQEEGGGGELALISSGESISYMPDDAPATYQPKPNILLSVAPDGSDVVFLTQDTLVAGAGEGGTSAIYDARANGGFPEPALPVVCLEEGCKPAPGPAPSLPGAPHSEATHGAGNVKPGKKHKRRCQRAAKQRKGKRCAKKRARGSAARASAASSPSGSASAPSAPGPSSWTEGSAEPRSTSSASNAPVGSAGPFDEFGIESVSAEYSPRSAGMHPDFTSGLTISHFIEGGGLRQNAKTEEVSVSLPPGLVGNLNAIPKCSTATFVSGFAPEDKNCSVDSIVGVADFKTTLIGAKTPLFNLQPPHPDREIARLGFFAWSFPVFIDISLRTAGDYNPIAAAHSSSGLDSLIRAGATVWGNPSDPSHDKERATPQETFECGGAVCKAGGRVQQFSPEGAYLSEFSSYDSQGVELANPQGIAIDAAGDVWVADTGNDRIQHFEPDGTPIGTFGSAGAGAGQFRAPQGIAIDAAGDVWVADTGNNRIQELEPDGSFIRAVGTLGVGAGQFVAVQDLSIAPSGNVLAVSVAGQRRSNLPPTALLSNPSACQEMRVDFAVKSYQRPGETFTASAPMDPVTDCQGLPFSPSFEAEPTDPTAGAPTGLKTTLIVPQQPTEAVDSPSTATMREARVSLPEGMMINPAAADGIATCSDEQVGFHEEANAACPDASKLGVATITSPALSKPLQGEVFQRAPRPGHLFGLWLVTDEMGLHVKIPGELETDKETGQLTAVFSDLPQVPTEKIELTVWGGKRAPLVNPDSCGTYSTSYAFAPHSQDPALLGKDQMTIDRGCGAGFDPKLHAGTANPVAGQFSPFALDLERADGDQNLASVDVTLPDGLLAKIEGVGLCPEGAIPSGNCPADSKLGHLTAAVGAGPNPFWIPEAGKSPTAVYFAGPYKGAPYSIVTAVPAQAGPFDLGVVVVRSALQVDPETAKATVHTDPLPQFIEGVAALYRRVHVTIDRPEFMLNPTDCSELAIASHLTSNRGAVAEPSARFEVDGCKALKYGPKLKLRFKGGTKRSDHPALKAVLTQPPGQANTAKATVVLPTSQFIDQDHINNPCTRVQFRAGKCPKLSVLGRATAVTPLLGEPLKGPVYFRSNGGERELPDIVADLRGPIHVTIVGFVDSVPVKGTELSRLRTRFATVPDAPVTRFAMNLLGGRKRGLLENSRDLCRTSRRAKVALLAQNGRQSNRNLLIETSCGRGG